MYISSLDNAGLNVISLFAIVDVRSQSTHCISSVQESVSIFTAFSSAGTCHKVVVEVTDVLSSFMKDTDQEVLLHHQLPHNCTYTHPSPLSYLQRYGVLVSTSPADRLSQSQFLRFTAHTHSIFTVGLSPFVTWKFNINTSLSAYAV